MSYSYKTVLRRENHDFDISQDKANSRFMNILAINKKVYKMIHLGLINNKTGEITIYENSFKEKTIYDLKSKLL